MWRRAVFFVLLAGSAAGQECREDTVFLSGDWGSARFSVEIADDPGERSRGLMHRESLPLSAGMLFVYPEPQAMSFWMRNTLIELDMLFVDPQGVVQHIHDRAQPLDETPIFGGTDLTHVLEINGGLAERLGITEGTVLRHPSFDAATAAAPC
jgi:uncharacterized membrane protein (UPF0127 family)